MWKHAQSRFRQPMPGVRTKALCGFPLPGLTHKKKALVTMTKINCVARDENFQKPATSIIGVWSQVSRRDDEIAVKRTPIAKGRKFAYPIVGACVFFHPSSSHVISIVSSLPVTIAIVVHLLHDFFNDRSNIGAGCDEHTVIFRTFCDVNLKYFEPFQESLFPV